MNNIQEQYFREIKRHYMVVVVVDQDWWRCSENHGKY